MCKFRWKKVCLTAAAVIILVLVTVAFCNRDFLDTAIRRKLFHDYSNISVTWYGDSNTFMNEYCQIVNDYFNFNGFNAGINGSTVSGETIAGMCSLDRIIKDTPDDEEYIPKDSQIIFVMGGINDWLADIPLGKTTDGFYEVNSEDFLEELYIPNNFSQGCNLMFYRLKREFPDAYIVVLGTTFASAVEHEEFPGENDIYNSQGLSSTDYGRRLCEIAQMWGIRNINMGDCLDWNENNICEKTVDGIHFNKDVGALEVADIIIDFIKKSFK